MIDIHKRGIWTGKWQWNKETAHFSTPGDSHAWTDRFQEVVVKDNTMLMRTFETKADGIQRIWRWEGQFDGQPRPIIWEHDGSEMATIAFTFVEELVGGDIFFGPGGTFRGAEYFILGQDNCKVWGSMTVEGKQYPYFEEWDRIN